MRITQLRLLILACALSAGIHAALAPEHFRETTAAGAGFVASAVLLAALAVVLSWRPSAFADVSAALVFAGLIVAYVAAVTTGIPVLHPERDAVEGLALATKVIEAIGVAAAVPWPRLAIHLIEPKGSST
jgi:hypothetical protein